MRSAISTASRALLTTALAASAATAVITAAPSEAAAQVSIVRINGIATPVYFNDGDTFRPLGGPFRFRPARLAGFNTLESYGPTHQWGGWTYKELYVNAKQATLNARTEIWNCKADDTQKDGYGRILAICIDLGADHIRKGLAHAYNIDKPADWRFLQAQRDAIVHRRGMWAKGVPPLVLTSLHSVDERFDNENNYNR
ncbi:MAG: thermonuclease family protein, partial [Myxococcales bacterium]|nr:thermonuclease family protein [Myxococcales bacterium]